MPVRAAIERWIRTRTPRLPGPVPLTRRRIYILPTRFGYGYALLALVILAGAMNYSNSLAFCLAFLLAGLGLVGMHHTHATLLGLEIHARRALPVFAGERIRFHIGLHNPTRRHRYAIALGWNAATMGAGIDVDAGDTTVGALELCASRRGWCAAPRFAVQTEFPLGLFHAWSWVELELRCLVYPAPAGARPLPRDDCSHRDRRRLTRAGGDDFAGLRDYRPGDAIRAIHWKSLPRSWQPMVKTFADVDGESVRLDWSALSDLDTEARLSQLTRWILDCDARGLRYALHLPTSAYPESQGVTHRDACLRALALYGDPAC